MKFFMIAGEKSGDKQGALLIRELLARAPHIQIEGLGGAKMQALAPHIEDWTEEAAVVGVIDVLRNISYFKRYLDAMTARIVQEKPDCLILIDYPGFNQRLAQRIHKLCPQTKLVWFIAPMVWAWHKGRIPKLANMLDLMLCTFPFETKLFADAGLKSVFVGHPLVDDILAHKRDDVRDPYLIGLFPGSRRREIERHFPIFLETVQFLRIQHPEWKFVTSASSEKLAASMQEMAQKAGVPEDVIDIHLGNYHDLMDRSQAALVASGTATLEAALHELPFALVYKVSWGTYWIARCLLTIKHIGMVNILVDKPVIRELIQSDFSVENCVAELERLMKPDTREHVLAEMRASMDTLGHGGAAAHAAEAILQAQAQA